MDAATEAESLLERAGVRILDDLRLLRVGGDDAASWLQGQVTQDVLPLRPGESAYTLILGTNGKVKSDAWAYRRAGDLLLALPASVAEDVRAHFDAHVIMEDVELALEADRALVSVQGRRADALRPSGVDAEIFAADRFGLGAGFDAIVTRGAAEAFARGIGADAISADAWELARIRRSVPKLGVDFGANTLPQEAGLARAVSFTKGCYLGQEPVIMLEHRGSPPKRLFVVRASATLPAEAPLVTESGEIAGRMTSCASVGDPDGVFAGLALIKKAHAVERTTLVSGDVRVHLIEAVGHLP
jgi:folate-binding protein YgfZ